MVGTDTVVACRPMADDPSEVRESRRWLAGLLARQGAEPDLVERAVICLSELATNALAHGTSPREVVVLVDDTVQIEVRDGMGGGAQGATRASDEPGELGLSVVDALSESWGSDHPGGRTRWWCRLRAASSGLDAALSRGHRPMQYRGAL